MSKSAARQGCSRAALALALVLAGPVWSDYSENPRALAWTADMVRKHGWARSDLLALLGEAECVDAAVEAIKRPAESKEWAEYQDIFITDKRIAGGREFAQSQGPHLARAEVTYGVPAEIIVAILGVETYYGQRMGSYRVVDSLATQAFEFEPGSWRARFGAQQLEQLVLLSREQGVDPLTLVGSYAGAMGYGQFIPSSYRHYAVDFDGDGMADIWNNPVDAIGSIANYLSENGWQRGGGITVRAQAEASADRAAVNRALRADSTVQDLAGMGYRALEPVPEQPAGAVELKGKQGSEYWLGLTNYYVITTYNHSRLYAMAVNQLSELVKVPEDADNS